MGTPLHETDRGARIPGPSERGRIIRQGKTNLFRINDLRTFSDPSHSQLRTPRELFLDPPHGCGARSDFTGPAPERGNKKKEDRVEEKAAVQLERPRNTPSDPETDYEKLLLENLETIERIARQASRKVGMRGADAEDFSSDVKLKLIENDYRVLRKFGGASRLSTYLHTVIHNLARDVRAKAHGKWRPSAMATKLGTRAQRLEELVYRDGWSSSEAIAILRQREVGCAAPIPHEEILARLPVRQRPVSVPLHEARPHRIRVTHEHQGANANLDRVEELLAQLPKQDLRLVEARFSSDMTIASLARHEKRNVRKLYARLERCLEKLRAGLDDK